MYGASRHNPHSHSGVYRRRSFILRRRLSHKIITKFTRHECKYGVAKRGTCSMEHAQPSAVLRAGGAAKVSCKPLLLLTLICSRCRRRHAHHICSSCCTWGRTRIITLFHSSSSLLMHQQQQQQHEHKQHTCTTMASSSSQRCLRNEAYLSSQLPAAAAACRCSCSSALTDGVRGEIGEECAIDNKWRRGAR